MTTGEPVGRVTRGVEREQFWRGHIEGQAASGLSARRWCQREQLSEPSVYSWRRKLAQRDQDRSLSESRGTATTFCRFG